MGLIRQLVLKASLFVVVLLVVVGVEYVLFQSYFVSCPSSVTSNRNQCWVIYYAPPLPSKGPANMTGLLHTIMDIKNAYGLGQPTWVRVFDYYRLMLTSNFGYNVGGALGGTVLGTIQQRIPYTVLLVFTSALVALAGYEVLQTALRAGKSRRLGIPPIAGFLALNAVISGVFVWGLYAAIHSGTGSWITSLTRAVPSWYVPLGAATLLKSGLAYDAALLGALSLPFLTLTLVGFLSLLLVRLANRDPVHNLTAFSIALMSALSWSLLVEPVFGWPGLGQAIYVGVVSTDLPLEQASVFEISLMALVPIFCVYVGRDITAFMLEHLGRLKKSGEAVPLADSSTLPESEESPSLPQVGAPT